MKVRRVSVIVCISALALGGVKPALAQNEVPSVTVREGKRYATIWIYPDCPVTISYRTEAGSAKPGKDYGAVSGHMLRGGAQAFRIPIVNDSVRERTESVRVVVDITTQEVWFGVGAAGCSPGTPTFQTIEATMTILDND